MRLPATLLATPLTCLPLCAIAAPAVEDAGLDDMDILALATLAFLVVYFIPSYIAFYRQHPNRWLILVINTGLGLTGVIWLGCIIWALQIIHLSGEDGSDGGESGLNLFANDEQRVRLTNVEGSATFFQPSTDDYLSMLMQLKNLHETGALSDEEFSLLKERLLSEQSHHS